MDYIAGSLALIGLVFIVLAAVGFFVNGKQCAIALDQWIGTCLIAGHMADETISAMAHRNHWKRTERLINWLFDDPNHCAEAYVAELEHKQSPKEYQ